MKLMLRSALLNCVLRCSATVLLFVVMRNFGIGPIGRDGDQRLESDLLRLCSLRTAVTDFPDLV